MSLKIRYKVMLQLYGSSDHLILIFEDTKNILN
jgi:hypothetical protein